MKDTNGASGTYYGERADVAADDLVGRWTLTSSCGRGCRGGGELTQELEDLPGDWEVLSQAVIGDAQSAADAFLISGEGGLKYTNASDYVLVDGFVGGLWSVTAKKGVATLELTPFGPMDRADRRALEDEGERLMRFVAADARSHEVHWGS